MKEKFLKRLADVLGVTYKNLSIAYELVENEFDKDDSKESFYEEVTDEVLLDAELDDEYPAKEDQVTNDELVENEFDKDDSKESSYEEVADEVLDDELTEEEVTEIGSDASADDLNEYRDSSPVEEGQSTNDSF